MSTGLKGDHIVLGHDGIAQMRPKADRDVEDLEEAGGRSKPMWLDM